MKTGSCGRRRLWEGAARIGDRLRVVQRLVGRDRHDQRVGMIVDDLLSWRHDDAGHDLDGRIGVDEDHRRRRLLLFFLRNRSRRRSRSEPHV